MLYNKLKNNSKIPFHMPGHKRNTKLLGNKFPYELRTNAEIYEEWGDDETTSTAARDDVMRIFGRKDIKLSDEECAEIHDYIFTKIFGADDIRKLANEMIISQWLSFGRKQAGGN